MDSNRLLELTTEVRDLLRKEVVPQLSLEEYRTYARAYVPRIEFTRQSLSPSRHILVTSVSPNTASVLDAIVTRAIFGLSAMKNWSWFRVQYRAHASRLASIPDNLLSRARRHSKLDRSLSLDEMHRERANDTHAANPVTSHQVAGTDPFAHEFTQKLMDQVEMHEQERRKLQARHMTNLYQLFGDSSKNYPGLLGVLIGVELSLRKKSDNSMNETLVHATVEYLNSGNPSGKSA